MSLLFASIVISHLLKVGKALSRIKIISNPYQRSTTFQSWKGEWEDLGKGNNPNSSLLSKQFAQGFFPFKVYEIVGQIIEEYGHEGEVTEIVFEGPDDEWKELSVACSAPGLDGQIVLTRGDRALANARDILPYVKTEFNSVYPIFANYLDGRPDSADLIKKFREATSDDVPICVVGNYSSGKSTFINALLGIELLPSGDKPLTSRIFKIERSDQEDRASIEVDYMQDRMVVSFGANSANVRVPEPIGELARAIIAAIPEGDASPIIVRVRKVLTLINESKSNEEGLGSLVEVKIPYKRAEWMGDRRFVIFDTPGSNSNSNAHHFQVLQEAMRGMSDGLPIYVAEYSALDSNDNAELYDEIKRIEALDERFAMIVVNKADSADLPEGSFSEEEKEEIRNYAVVKNLYAQGVFFVSSIIGLGAKTKGELFDRYYDRCFQQHNGSYEDPEDRFYTKLYEYDIMPEQLRASMLEEASACPNLLLSNSGLFSIECGIEDFASKYSVYNKCFQSDALLDELIEVTDEELEKAALKTEESRRLGESDLDQGRADRLNKLQTVTEELSERARSEYYSHMGEYNYTEGLLLSTEALCAWEEELTDAQQKNTGVEEKSHEARVVRDTAMRKLREHMANIVDSRDLLGLGDLVSSLIDDVPRIAEAYADENDARRSADLFASEDLLKRIREHFDSSLNEAMDAVEARSKQYWDSRVEECRASLLSAVSEGEGIDENRQAILKSIIMNFASLDLNDASPEIMEIRSPFNPDKLWKAPISIQHNMELSRRIRQWRLAMEPAHEESFVKWLRNLVSELTDNIVNLNPELRKKLEFIRQNERDLEDLQIKRNRLRRAEEHVSSLMAWRGEA